MIGHRLRRERRGGVYVPSPPQCLFSHCCSSCCMPSFRARRQGSQSHNNTFYRSSSQEPHPPLVTSMRSVTSPLGCSSQSTYHLVPPHRQTTRSLASCLPTRLILLLPWTPVWPSTLSPSSQSLMGPEALLVTTPRSDYHVGLADEYQSWLAQISMKVCSFYHDGCHTYASSGTFFTSPDFQTEDISYG